MRAFAIDSVSYPDLALDWTFDPAAAVVIVAMASTWVVLRRRRSGWPASRDAGALAAFAAAVLATQSGVATHDTSSLTAHVLQHVLLGMAVPLLAALAAPVTLVLQAADPTTRQVVRRALHSPVARILSHPVLGFGAFGASLVVLTFSPLLDVAARNDVVHLLVHVHLVVIGSLFVWPLIGIDPVPERPAHGARLLIVMASVPFHAFVGVALLSASTPLFDVYPSIDDQRRAAGLLWGAGELFTLAMAGVVFVDWYRADQRAGARHDRRTIRPDSASVGEPGEG